MCTLGTLRRGGGDFTAALFQGSGHAVVFIIIAFVVLQILGAVQDVFQPVR